MGGSTSERDRVYGWLSDDPSLYVESGVQELLREDRLSGMEVDLYRTDDYIKSDKVPLLPLLRSTFETLLGQSLAGAQFWLTFLPVPDDSVLDGEPVMVNLRRGYGYLTVRITRDNVVLYQHPHSVQELVAAPLQRMLAVKEPEERHWGFG